VWTTSAEARWYVLGSFERGLAVAAQVTAVESAGATRSDQALAAAALVGYKLVARAGFTFDAQLGDRRAVPPRRAETNADLPASRDRLVVLIAAGRGRARRISVCGRHRWCSAADP